jgi:hypothetical protein
MLLVDEDVGDSALAAQLLQGILKVGTVICYLNQLLSVLVTLLWIFLCKSTIAILGREYYVPTWSSSIA